MNREIRFRGITKIDNRMINGPTIQQVDEMVYIFPDDPNELDSPDFYEVIPETVGQYTGLKDKNGKEIYEGDQDSLGNVVVFMDGKFKTTYKGDRQGGSELSEKRCKYLEIIGNIHLTPTEGVNITEK